MEIIVRQIDEAISYFADLDKWARTFDDDPDDPDFDAVKYLEGDPDIFRFDGNKTYFMAIELNGVKYVLTHQEVSKPEKKMLEHFHNDNFAEHFSLLPSCWDTFNNTTRAIAYRGGSGYNYTIWEYKHTPFAKHSTSGFARPK